MLERDNIRQVVENHRGKPGATLSIRNGNYLAGPRTITRRVTLTSNSGMAVIQ